MTLPQPTKTLPRCPQCHEPAAGTVETATGIAWVSGVDADGELEYDGEMRIDWDSQTTNENAAGEREWWCRPCGCSFFARIAEEA